MTAFFSRADPVLTFETDYAASPRSDNHPSEYTFTFSKLRIKDSRNGKVILKSTPSQHTAQKQFSSAYDMHSLEVIEHREQVTQAKNEYRDEYGWAYNTHGNGVMTAVSFCAGTKGFRFDASYAILPWIFIGGHIGGNYKVPDELKAEIRERKNKGGGKTLILGGYVGANMSLFHIGPLHPIVYGTLGVAMANVFDKGSSDKNENLSYNTGNL